MNIEEPNALIILSHLEVQNANAISSPLTWGFPSISSVLGFVHALERKASVNYPELKLSGVGVISHKFLPQIYRANQWSDAVFCLTRNPLNEKGETPALAEEGRAYVEFSLIIQAFSEKYFIQNDQKEEIAQHISELIPTLRFAGGSFIFRKSKYIKVDVIDTPKGNTQEEKTKNELRKLLPGFALISREDLFETEKSEANNLDILLKYSSLNFEPVVADEKSDKVQWNIVKKPGWIVPISTGYIGLSEKYEPGIVLNVRDNTYPFQFVENIYSLGQWISPHRIKNMNDIFWHYEVDVENSLYRCVNNPQDFLNITHRSDNDE